MSKHCSQRNRGTAFKFSAGCSAPLAGGLCRGCEAYSKAIDSLPSDSPQRPVWQWNLRLAYLEARGEYPGDLQEPYQIQLATRTASSPVIFTDVAAAFTVNKKDRGRGSAWGDFDGDGDVDLFTVGIQVPTRSTATTRAHRLRTSPRRPDFTMAAADGVRYAPTTITTGIWTSTSPGMLGGRAPIPCIGTEAVAHLMILARRPA